MKHLMIPMIAVIAMFAGTANAAYVCQVNALIFAGPPNSTDTNDSQVVTGTLFRGTDTDQCAKAQALYTKLFGELLTDLYPTPAAGIEIGHMLNDR